jgi:hypothetical protein
VISPYSGGDGICPNFTSPVYYHGHLFNTGIKLNSENMQLLKKMLIPPDCKTACDIANMGYSDALSFIKNKSKNEFFFYI